MKISSYSLGLLSGILLTYLYYVSAVLVDSVNYKKQLIEKFKEAESVTQKNTEIIRKLDILTKEKSILSENNANLESQLNGYKEIENERSEKEKISRLGKEKLRIAYRLAEYTYGIKLTKTQEMQIREWIRDELDYLGMSQAERNNLNDSSPPNVIEQMKSILSDVQLQSYELHAIHLKNIRAEFLASSELGQYPSGIELSEEQKDIIYDNLYRSAHLDYAQEYYDKFDDLKNKEIYGQGAKLIWAAQDLLTEEQMAILKQSLTRPK